MYMYFVWELASGVATPGPEGPWPRLPMPAYALVAGASYLSWCCWGLLPSVVLLGPLTFRGVAGASYRPWCCWDLLPSVVLLGSLTVRGIAGVSSYSHHHPLRKAQEIRLHVAARLFLFVPIHRTVRYLREGTRPVGKYVRIF